MTAVWTGIDPDEAENRLRALRRRIGDLDAAIAVHNAVTSDLAETFAFRLALRGLVQRRERLGVELDALMAYRSNACPPIGLA